jgi:hypothetical protein
MSSPYAALAKRGRSTILAGLARGIVRKEAATKKVGPAAMLAHHAAGFGVEAVAYTTVFNLPAEFSITKDEVKLVSFICI